MLIIHAYLYCVYFYPDHNNHFRKPNHAGYLVSRLSSGLNRVKKTKQKNKSRRDADVITHQKITAPPLSPPSWMVQKLAFLKHLFCFYSSVSFSPSSSVSK